MQLVDNLVNFLFDKVVDVGKVKQFQKSEKNENLLEQESKDIPVVSSINQNKPQALDHSVDLNLEKYSPIANTSMNNLSINLRSSKYNNPNLVQNTNEKNLKHEKNILNDNNSVKKEETTKRIKTFGKSNNNTSMNKRSNNLPGNNLKFFKNVASNNHNIKPSRDDSDFFHPELTHASSLGLEKLITETDNSFHSASPTKDQHRANPQKESLKRSPLKIFRPSVESNTSNEKKPIMNRLKGFKNSNKN